MLSPLHGTRSALEGSRLVEITNLALSPLEQPTTHPHASLLALRAPGGQDAYSLPGWRLYLLFYNTGSEIFFPCDPSYLGDSQIQSQSWLQEFREVCAI